LSNLADWSWWTTGPERGLNLNSAATQASRRIGDVSGALWDEAQSLRMLFDLGRWDEVLGKAEELMDWDRRHGGSDIGAITLPVNAAVLLLRGRRDKVAKLRQALLFTAATFQDLQTLVPALACGALVEVAFGEQTTALSLLSRFEQATEGSPNWRARHLPDVTRVLASVDKLILAERITPNESDVSTARDKHSMITAKAILAEARDDTQQAVDAYKEAARRWRDYGHVLEEGQAHFGLARCLIALGDREAVSEPLQKARAIFTKLGARPLIAEVDRHLGEEQALSG
jgi:tetratricopeptide (TPR) repeat protein